MTLSEMADADKKTNPRYFGSDLADIRIRINSEIRIRLLDHFCSRLWPWRRFSLSEHDLVSAVTPDIQ